MSDEQNPVDVEKISSNPADKVRQLLDSVSDLANQKLDDQIIAQAWHFLDDARNLVGETPEIEQWQKHLSVLQRNHLAQKRFEEIRKACDDLWKQEQVLLKQNVTTDRILNEVFVKALELVQDAAKEYPHSLALDGLKNDANLRYQMARKRYEIKTTADQTQEYRDAFEKLDALEDKDTLIPWQDASGQQLPPISARDAALEFLKLGSDFAHKKAQEYFQLAQLELDKHSPRVAREHIENRKKLWELPPEDDSRLEKYLDERIQPELDKLIRAEGLLKQASAAGSVLCGWKNVDEAIAIYAWVPGIETVRNTLVERMLHQLPTILDDVAMAYQAFCTEFDNSVLENTSNKLAEAGQLLDIVRSYLGQFPNPSNQEKLANLDKREKSIVQDITAARKFIEGLESELAEIEIVFNQQPSQAHTDLEGLLATYQNSQYQKYGDLEMRFPRLKGLQDRVLAFQDFETSLQKLEHDFETNQLDILQKAEKSTRAIVDSEKDTKKRGRVHLLLNKLQLRQEFLRAQEILQETGDVSEAIKHLNKVVAQEKHPDKPAAQELLRRLQDEHKNEQKITDALSKADALLQTNPGRAYEVLNAVLKIPTQQKEELTTKLEQARVGWEQYLLTRLDDELNASSLNPDVVCTIANSLLALPPPRTDEADIKARKALARIFALEAGIHAEANHWESAEKSWQSARQHDVFNLDYELGWQEARLRRAKNELENAKSQSEIEGMLDNLQAELPEVPGVFELQAEYSYQLSQILALGAEARLSYLNRAYNAIKTASSAPGVSQALQGRLEDLKKQVAADEKLLKTQNDIEQRMSSDASLTQLLEAKQEVTRMLENSEISPTSRKGLNTWWRLHLSKIVKSLEAQDDVLTDDQAWLRFEIRSKIYFLEPGNVHAQALIRSVPLQADTLLDEINALSTDYIGISLQEKDAISIVKAQQKRISELRERAQTLYEMVNRLASALGETEANRLKTEFKDALGNLQTWTREFEAFRQGILRLHDFLHQARQDNDLSDFDKEQQRLNGLGFSGHRSIRMLLDERDAIVKKRQALEGLEKKIVEAINGDGSVTGKPQGLRLVDALHWLDILEKDPLQGDPGDNFGIQAELQIIDPLTDKAVRTGLTVRRWLDERLRQIELVVHWVVECGLVDLLPQDTPVQVDISQAKKIVPWVDLQKRLKDSLDEGRFEEVLLVLDTILQNIPDSAELGGKIAGRKGEVNFPSILKSYAGTIRLANAYEKAAHPPISIENANTMFARELLNSVARHARDVLSKEIESAKELRKTALTNQRQWQSAEIELEQSLRELQVVNNRRNFFNKDAAIRARQRAERAKIDCVAIVPKHPKLNDIDELLK